MRSNAQALEQAGHHPGKTINRITMDASVSDSQASMARFCGCRFHINPKPLASRPSPAHVHERFSLVTGPDRWNHSA